ncbi:hypothetical protein FB561_7374 [Kribbella amoyensis]|uniref:Uncharacterized protein n=1 Tax=Kribbella amoyensis TaxID=996641 RepID=A0A561B3R0_9ACTN|nr:hypothetical protein [Kribbella amoyensis]TWD73481.1 hypothetical protein FB561_7374 [Kribbella amoyensis]
MPTWEEIQEARLSDVLELQKVHKRLLAAKEQGIDPDPADAEVARSVAATGLGGIDRVNARDDY